MVCAVAENVVDVLEKLESFSGTPEYVWRQLIYLSVKNSNMAFVHFWFTPQDVASKACESIYIPESANDDEYHDARIKNDLAPTMRYLIYSTKFSGVCFQSNYLDDCFTIDPAILGNAYIVDVLIGLKICSLIQNVHSTLPAKEGHTVYCVKL